MAEKSAFKGFSKQTVNFYKDLAANNDKKWFEQNRAAYDDHVLAPSRDFVYEMGKRLKKIAPGVNADPRVDRSIFRIHRDVRFSKDKSPFKTHLGLWFWEGIGKRMEKSGFYFQLEPGSLFLAAGLYMFPDNLLTAYRDAVDDEKTGSALKKAMEKVVSKSDYSVGGEHYQRVPRGYDKDHKRADLLRYNGLHAMIEFKIPKELFDESLPDWCFEHYKRMLPIHQWLVNLTEKK